MIPDIKNIRYVFADLDGTLLNDKKQITKKVKDTIHQFRIQTNLRFGIASGRSLNSLLPLLKEQGILTDIDMIVANNGVDFYVPLNQIHTRNYMITTDCIHQILEAYKGYEEVNICFHNEGVLYAQKVTQRTCNIAKINQLEVIFHPNRDQNFAETPRVMLLFDTEKIERIKQLVYSVKLKGVRGMFSEKDIYEYVHENVSKVTGIQQYVDNFQDTLENVLVIGDSYNDEEMLKQCGLGVVMRNASDEVKAYGDVISMNTNNEDGVAEILSSYWQIK